MLTLFPPPQATTQPGGKCVNGLGRGHPGCTARSAQARTADADANLPPLAGRPSGTSSRKESRVKSNPTLFLVRSAVLWPRFFVARSRSDRGRKLYRVGGVRGGGLAGRETPGIGGNPSTEAEQQSFLFASGPVPDLVCNPRTEFSTSMRMFCSEELARAESADSGRGSTRLLVARKLTLRDSRIRRLLAPGAYVHDRHASMSEQIG